jgi:hypothetical protein
MLNRICAFYFCVAVVMATPWATCAAVLSMAITNPAPATQQGFGSCITAIGTDKICIGASDNANRAGTAYLFHVDGTLLTNFTNPNGADGDYFGASAAALGSEAVILGSPFQAGPAPRVGAAYLFGTNGALMTTFTNPAPSGYNNFGVAVTSVGPDKVLIGANRDNTGSTAAGAVYLFATNGSLLTAFTNPAPAADENFGIALAALHADRVIIGAQMDDGDNGAAYLFNISGDLLTTFTNPAPSTSAYFGSAVASLGEDKVLIAAMGGEGSAYLFSTNGSLLMTFTNPSPASYDWFGSVVASMAGERVIITAFGSPTGAQAAGVAYVFHTNGSLLTTLTNPSPALGDHFGSAAAVLAPDQLLVTATGDDTTKLDAGITYLFDLSGERAPSLKMGHVSDGLLRLDWPATAAAWLLEESDVMTGSNSWAAVSPPFQTNLSSISVNLIPMGNRFYRLRRP